MRCCGRSVAGSEWRFFAGGGAPDVHHPPWQPVLHRGLGILAASAAARVPCTAAARRQYRFLAGQPASRGFSSRAVDTGATAVRGGIRHPLPALAACQYRAELRGWVSAARPNPLPGTSVRACSAVPVAISRAASFGPRCRRDDGAAPPSDRVHTRLDVLLAHGHHPRYSCDHRAEPRPRAFRTGCGSAREHPASRTAGALAAACANYHRPTPSSPLRLAHRSKLELWRGALGLGQAVWDLHPNHPGTARGYRVRCSRIGATPLPDTIGHVLDSLGDLVPCLRGRFIAKFGPPT